MDTGDTSSEIACSRLEGSGCAFATAPTAPLPAFVLLSALLRRAAPLLALLLAPAALAVDVAHFDALDGGHFVSLEDARPAPPWSTGFAITSDLAFNPVVLR